MAYFLLVTYKVRQLSEIQVPNVENILRKAVRLLEIWSANASVRTSAERIVSMMERVGIPRYESPGSDFATLSPHPAIGIRRVSQSSGSSGSQRQNLETQSDREFHNRSNSWNVSVHSDDVRRLSNQFDSRFTHVI
jgi:hypothetical protein